MFDRIIHWSLRNRLLVVTGTVVFFCAGVWVLGQMPVDVFPEFAPPQVIVQTEAPGVAPEDVEALISFPIESAVNGLPGVTAVRSASSAGLSVVTVVFRFATDIYVARQLVNEQIQSVRDRFPPATHPPVMLPVTSSIGWMVKYSLQSDTRSLMELRTLAEWEIRPRLLALGGVASVVAIGGEVKQYQALLDPDRLRAYRVTAEEVRTALARANVNAPGAFLTERGQEYAVTGVGRITSLDDVANTVIKFVGATPIFVRNVAEVRFGAAIKRGDGAFGGTPAVIGTVSKAYGADTLTTTRKVERALAEIHARLPADIRLDTHVFRQADFIESSIHNLRSALLEGAVIVTVILLLFLMNVRTAFISLVAIPASLLGGIMTLHAFGVGINVMTLGGLAVAVGEVVDDAIIDVENVFRRLRLNRQSPSPASALDVVFRASSEIRNSVVYATLIVVIVFVPLFFLTGLEGRIFTPLGIAYIAAIVASLAVTLTTVPVLCVLLLGRGRGAPGAEPDSAVVRFLKARYRRLLAVALARFGWVVGTALALVLAAASLLPFFGRSFLPEFHEGNFVIAMSTLPGTSLDESMRLGARVSALLLRHPQVVSVAQRAGRSELDDDALPPYFSEFDVRIDYERNPSVPAEELLGRVRTELAAVPGAVFNVGQFISHRMDEILSGVRAQIAIKVSGPDLDVLRVKGGEVLAALHTVEGAVDVQLEPQINVPQLVIAVDRERASRYGLTVGDLADDIETLLNGSAVSQVIEGQRAFDLFVRLAEPARDDVDAVRDMLVDAASGAKIPLRQVADVRLEARPFFINRDSAQRRVVVQCNVAGRDLRSVVTDARATIARQVHLPAGYFIEYGGQFESQQQASRVLTILGGFAVVGIFLMLHQAFGTVREALLVMFNLPLALIGGVVAVFLAGGDLSVASLIGFITLFGIATRNGIILVSHYNQLAAEGKSRSAIVTEGSMDRLTPVLMTAATTALALLPILWGEPTGKELQRPLAVVVVGGLFSSTLLNMIVVPVVYDRIEQWRERRARQGAEEGAAIARSAARGV